MADYDPRWGDAIASIESGGQSNPYTTVTPNPNGRRALGKYQVMAENVPEWTQAALGTSLTPEQFLNNPDAQEAVFKHRFGGYVNQYGSPQDAASAWFTGRPFNAQSAGAHDSLGTTGASYVAKFNKALGQPTDGPTAIQQAMHMQQGTGMTPMAYADDGTGALSTDATAGPGVLATGTRPDTTPAGSGFGYGGTSLHNRLLAAAASLQSVYNPQGAAVLNAQIKQATPADQFTTTVAPDGSLLRINSKTGAVEKLPGNYAKDDPNDTKVDPKVLTGLSEDWGSKYGNLQNAAEQAAKYEDLIRGGKLDLGPVAAAKAAAESALGKTSPQTQNYNAFQAFRTSLANDSLRLNKGVQTEGDAARARQELATAFGVNDPATVANALRNFIQKTGSVMHDSAKSQLDSYSSAYKNKAPFTPYYSRLQQQQQFYDDYAKSHPDVSSPTAPTVPNANARPPLSSFNR